MIWTLVIKGATHSVGIEIEMISNRRWWWEKANKKEEMMLLLNYVTKLIALHNMCTSEMKKSREMVG